jgi:glycerophosphoryl diester phosphodiesterase
MAITFDWSKTLPVVIAHRGASFYAPENTMPAFEMAYQQGAQAIELDVKLTGDGHIVAMHDSRVDRTTDGTGKVNSLTLEEIVRLDAGSWKDDRFRQTQVPTLKDILIAFMDRLLFNIELTNYTSPTDGLPETTILLIRELTLENRVLLSSFNPLALLKAYRLAPEIPIGLLVHPGQPGIIRWLLASLIKHKAWHPHESLLASDRRIQRAHQQGKSINVWTVNQHERMQELLDWGVDGIMTDDPRALVRALSEGTSTV